MIKTMEDLKEDLVFLAIKGGLPEGYEVTDAKLVEPEIFKPKQPRKLLYVAFVETKTKRKWTQSFNYKKIERQIERGIQIAADRT